MSLVPRRQRRGQLGTWADLTEPMHRQLDRMFEDFFDEPRGALLPILREGGGFNPKVDVCETEKEIELTAELPGLEEKDVEVSLTEGVLTIRGEKKSEKEERDEKTNYYRVERSYGSFQRSFPLPPTVDEGKIAASFDKGVLKVVAPKSAEAKAGTRKIDVRKA